MIKTPKRHCGAMSSNYMPNFINISGIVFMLWPYNQVFLCKVFRTHSGNPLWMRILLTRAKCEPVWRMIFWHNHWFPLCGRWHPPTPSKAAATCAMHTVLWWGGSIHSPPVPPPQRGGPEPAGALNLKLLTSQKNCKNV